MRRLAVLVLFGSLGAWVGRDSVLGPWTSGLIFVAWAELLWRWRYA